MIKEKITPQEYLAEEEMNLKIVSLKCQTEEEIYIKGSLEGFLIKKHYYGEYEEFQRTHDMTSADCHEIIPITIDPIKEAQKEYGNEKNLKNNMYKFIIEHGLFCMLLEYIEVNGIQIPDGRIHELPGVLRRVFFKPEGKEKKKKKHQKS